MTRDAHEQLFSKGRVTTGQFRHVAEHLGFLVEFCSSRIEWWYLAIAGMKYYQKYMLRVTSAKEDATELQKELFLVRDGARYAKFLSKFPHMSEDAGVKPSENTNSRIQGWI